MPLKMKTAAAKATKHEVAPPPKMEVKFVDLASLTPYGNNPRINDHAVDGMADLLTKFGWQQPILVRGVRIVDGHLRYKAATKLGHDKVPVLDVGALTEAEERALRLAMNKSAEFAEWDTAALMAEIDFLKAEDFDVSFTGFSDKEVAKLMKDILKDAEKATTKTKSADAGTEADPNYVSMTFHMAEASRKKVFHKLDKIMEAEGLKNRSQALLSLCS